MDIPSIASIALTLFLVLDPFGNLVVIHNVMARVPERRRTAVLFRELVIALALLLFFLVAGKFTLSLLGVRQDALSISGGILLFLIALGMVFPEKAIIHDNTTEEPFIVPIAVPLIAGPSAIALLLLISSRNPGAQWASALAILLAWAGSTAVLLVGPWLLRLFGKRGTQALERLMGLLLILISVQMFLDGIGHHQP
jgi:multiple antibiotic resistance protein